MSRGIRLLLSAPALFTPFFFALAARAAEGAGGVADQPIGITFKWIHFVLLAVFLIWLFGFGR